jgi:hypothetical protein
MNSTRLMTAAVAALAGTALLTGIAFANDTAWTGRASVATTLRDGATNPDMDKDETTTATAAVAVEVKPEATPDADVDVEETPDADNDVDEDNDEDADNDVDNDDHDGSDKAKEQTKGIGIEHAVKAPMNAMAAGHGDKSHSHRGR